MNTGFIIDDLYEINDEDKEDSKSENEKETKRKQKKKEKEKEKKKKSETLKQLEKHQEAGLIGLIVS